MHPDILNRKTLICYSAGSVALTVVYGFCGLYLLKFYTDIVGVDPQWVGLAFAVCLLVDAVSDPLMGYISDRHRFRQGRRRPYFLAGVVPAAIFLCQVMNPPDLSKSTLGFYLAILLALILLALTVMAIPHGALAFELTPDYDQRFRISGYKNFAELGATVLITVSVPFLLSLAQGEGPILSWSRRQCYSTAAFLVSVIAVAGTAMAYFGTREPDLPESQFRFGFWEGFRAAFSNRPFAILLATFTLVTVADRTAIAQLFIVLEHIHNVSEAESMPILLAQFLGAIASIAGWMWIGRRFGKKAPALAALCAWSLTYVALVFAGWSAAGLMAIFFLMGVCNTGVLVMLGAMAPDVIEWDELQSGQRREGTYVAIANLMWKVGLAVCFVIVGSALHGIGYDGSPTPTPAVVHGLRITFAAIPVALLAAAGTILSCYCITKESHQTTLQAIFERNDRRSLLDCNRRISTEHYILEHSPPPSSSTRFGRKA